jgi:hypothetical protein
LISFASSGLPGPVASFLSWQSKTKRSAASLADVCGVASGTYRTPTTGSGIKHLLRRLELPRPGADTQALEKGYVEVRVNSAIEVSTRLGNASLPLQHAKMLRSN